jgi:peptidoglycan/LPS O-acetylase OafA/YrhL
MSSLLIIDAVKALASQLIVWHHLVSYGPMSNTAHSALPRFMDWLYFDARLAVQVFLVVGGFLAARSLIPRPDQPAPVIDRQNLLRILWSRYARLAPVYVIALALAVAAAVIARRLIDDPDTPDPASFAQLLAHVFLLNDILHLPALSAGVWYVGVDFQLYALLATIVWAAQRTGKWAKIPSKYLVVAPCIGLFLSSLLWINLNPKLDQWGPYFFGAYGLGILVQWSSDPARRKLWLAVIACSILVALALAWRDRIAVAAGTACLLALGTNVGGTMMRYGRGLVSGLGRISYSVFLIHYPVCLLIGALIGRIWPGNISLSVIGLFASWLASLGAGALLHRTVEARIR